MCEQSMSRKWPAYQFSIKAKGLVWFLGISGVVLITGCSSTKPSFSNRMASIVVTNEPPENIDTTLRSVFKKHWFEETKGEKDELVFQRPGTFMNSLVYGDWWSGGVWERVKIYQRELDSERTVVECDGYMVQEHDDPLFQKEKLQYGSQKKHLQQLMDEVGTELRLGGVEPPPATSN